MDHPLQNLFSQKLPRRQLLTAGGMAGFGLTLPRWLAAQDQAAAELPAAMSTAKSVIFLYQFGGPSHVDTFDMKPLAPDGTRSQFETISTSVPGLSICEHLPRMAEVMNRVTLLRTVWHTMKNHNSASYYALTGHPPAVDDIRLRDTLDLFPAYGSVVDRYAPNTNGMPTFVAYPHVIRDGEVTPGQHASFLGKVHDPLLVTADPNAPGFGLPELSLPVGVSTARLENRRQLQQMINAQAKLGDAAVAARGLEDYYSRAVSMLNSPKIRQAFAIDEESASVRDRYGRTEYGQGCLLARRLVERGVKFVSVYYSKSIGGRRKEEGWDTHGFDNTRMYPILKGYHLPLLDQTLPTLILDLEERGLLDQTLIVWMGEFGRTPRLNANISRDHWPQCYSVLLAGGGTKKGYVHGTSDKTGAFPENDPVALDDLAATMFSAIGVPPETELRDRGNRPLAAALGRVVTDVFA
ncbi:hypothetical protein Spb1_05370 [Planctopirus ephydatiae]|uniref:Sulfatase n=1 Tax=Planctopirus ephydatiae TaxID=2528019 RepID=A0A518GJA6_9PLAN|nr:DUF1501 domain-containing protein [Planctopirus ephydatiae]QDV28672.1 hypothetical protein Spb1_05370 [Planctopirus ephydatiae]